MIYTNGLTKRRGWHGVIDMRRQSVEGLYRGAEHGFINDMADRSLVDRAVETGESRFNRGVQAAEHMQAATGGATASQATRGSVLAQIAGRSAVNAGINQASDAQQQIHDRAVQGLGQVRMGRLQNEAQQAMFREQMNQQRTIAYDQMGQSRNLATLQMDQQRAMHNESIDAQNKNAKRQFWGSMIGTGAGFAAAAFM